MIDLDGDRHYAGVTGWLTLFCIGLVFINPVLLLLRYGFGFQIRTATQHQIQTTLAGLLFAVAWAAAGAFIGYSIYRLHPSSIRWAKGYLLANGALSILAVLSRRGHLGPLIGVTIWYSYLTYSDQVKRLFPKSKGPEII